ncbi:hypothetical protein NDK25_23675 [Niallia taxi]|nr:hypothetical protein [Niallia taxi]MDE5055218.1 hypothetical protein [Niallia taxi]
MKKIILGISLLIVLIVAVILFMGLNNNDGIKITVTNNTDKPIDDLYINYKNLDEDIKLPKVSSKSKETLTIEPDVDESNLILYYFDRDGKKHEEFIIGYFERGYDGKVDIKINSMDDNGKLKLTYKN